jgi:acetyl esterase
MQVRIVDLHDLGGGVLSPDAEQALHPGGERLEDLADMPVKKMRRLLRCESLAQHRRTRGDPVQHVGERALPGRDGPFTVRVYRPRRAVPLPVLVFCHGGGWVIGDIDHPDRLCRRLAARVPCAVISVEYRRAPEHPYPAALRDVVDAIRWACTSAVEIGADPTRVAVGGESAGANLVAAACLELRDEGRPLVLQLLIQPVTDIASTETPSYQAFADGYGLTRRTMHRFRDLYLSNPTQAALPTVSPLRAEDLSGLPPAFVITSEFDVLRDEGEAYAQRLAEAGVPARCTRYLGVQHGFAIPVGILDEADLAADEIAGELREAFD